MKKNIQLDFTMNSSLDEIAQDQPLAIMPALLAKKLLVLLAANLSATTEYTILNTYRNELRNCNTIDEAKQVSIAWLQERQLIDNINAENWDAYAVAQPEQEVAEYAMQ